jgi:DNA-binding HxlR family transcriptional regulator
VKRYGQRCPAALALDVIGERWTLLIVRELLLGPRRYTDLATGLPGIASNVLTDRLDVLQRRGLVTKELVEPPTPAIVYELTEAGRALSPVLRELRRWGMAHGPSPEPSDAVRPGWILASLVDRPPGLPAGRSCVLRIGSETFTLTGRANGLEVHKGPPANSDATLVLDQQLLARLAGAGVDAAAAEAEAAISGDRRLARRALATIEGCAADPRTPRS